MVPHEIPIKFNIFQNITVDTLYKNVLGTEEKYSYILYIMEYSYMV